MSARAKLAALASCALLTLPWVLPPFYVGILGYTGLYAIVAAGLVLLLQAGLVSLGHAAFMGLGAYGSALVAREFGVNAFITIALAVALTAAVAAILGWITLRLRDHYLPLATLAWGIALTGVFAAWHEVTGGASGLDKIPALSVFGFELRDDRLYACLIWCIALLTVAGLARLRLSRTGRAIAALESHEMMAQSFGINTTALRIKVFVFSAVLAALAGGLYVHLIRFVSPSPFSLATSFKLLIMAVVGGPASGAGAVVGALTIESLQWGLQDLFARFGASGNYEVIFFGLILVVVLLKWPGGIWPLIERALPQRAATTACGIGLDKVQQVSGAEQILLEVRSVSKRFGGLDALQDVSLTIRKGELVGLIGPNGAGKTTLFSIVSGLQPPTTGSVQLRGRALPRRSDRIVRRGLARTFQHVQLIPSLSVLENVALGAHWRTRAGLLRGLCGPLRGENERALASAQQALERVGLGAAGSSLADSLPLGQQRVVEIARALLADPSVLLLDEPAAGLRFSEKLALVKILRQLQAEGMTILLVEHDMELVMSCVDRLIVLDRGAKIAEGHPKAIQGDPAVIEAYLGGSRDKAA